MSADFAPYFSWWILESINWRVFLKIIQEYFLENCWVDACNQLALSGDIYETANSINCLELQILVQVFQILFPFFLKFVDIVEKTFKTTKRHFKNKLQFFITIEQFLEKWLFFNYENIWKSMNFFRNLNFFGILIFFGITNFGSSFP